MDRKDNQLAIFSCLILPWRLVEWLHISPRRCYMQKVFETNCSLREYAEKGRAYPFPEPPICPCCKRSKPHKHGFYERFCLDGYISVRILVRRYYCRSCRATISFLP